MRLAKHVLLLVTFCYFPCATSATSDSAIKYIDDELTHLKFISIPAGEFTMGNQHIDEAIEEMPEADAAAISDETPAHKVKITGFLMASTEVTQALWLRIMQNRPGPKAHWSHEHWKTLPVVSISWNMAQAFIHELNKQTDKYQYRLPTEAEWEYAARADNQQLRPFTDDAMDDYAWYLLSSNDEVQSVATLKPNTWGLYDMYGNAWEWVSDWYHPHGYKQSALVDPKGPVNGNKKVRRGGSYHCPPHFIRPGYRAADTVTTAYSVHGFRLVAIDK